MVWPMVIGVVMVWPISKLQAMLGGRVSQSQPNDEKRTSAGESMAEIPGGQKSKAWLWLLRLIVAVRSWATRTSSLTSRRPGAVLLTAPAVATAARATLPTLGLKAAANFVAIHRAAVDQRKGAAPLRLRAERNVVPIDAARDRNRPAVPIQRAGKLAAVLLEL